jgi:sec-independent protein translocase protein TatA
MSVPHPNFAILDIGGTEILIIMVITLLLFGSERLPGLARSMGKSIREFKKATSGLEDELRRALETPPPSRRPPVPTAFPSAPPKPATVSSAPPSPATAPVAPPPAASPPSPTTPGATPPPPEEFHYP